MNLISEPDSVFWNRAFLEHRAEKKAREQFEAEQFKAQLWIANMIAHTGTMSIRFFTNNKWKGTLADYMPREWRDTQKENPLQREKRKRMEDEQLSKIVANF